MPYCISPLSVPRPNGRGSADRITAPCGKCIYCLQTKQSSWATRLEYELRGSQYAHFLTFTYTDENLPIDNEGQGHLVKSHFQAFLKRLRHFYPKVRVKYYSVGEYGSETLRPHFHGIFFNLPFPLVTDLDLRNMKRAIEPIWKNGNVDCGKVTPASIAYVTKYLINGMYLPDGLSPPFALMSKGLGSSYINDKTKKYHFEKQRFHITKQGGITTALPRYYKEKIFSDYEKRLNNQKLVVLADDKIKSVQEEAEKNNSSYGEYAIRIHQQVIQRIKTNKKLKFNL